MNDTLIERLDWVATVAEDTEGLGNKAYLICDKAVDTITIQAERIAELEAELKALREAAQDTQITLHTMLSDQNTYRFEGIYMDVMRERLYYHKEALEKLLEETK